MNQSIRSQKKLTALMLLVFACGFGYLHLLNRSVRSEQSKMRYLDTRVMQSHDMAAYTQKTDTDRILIQAIREDDAVQVASCLDQGMNGSTRIAGKPLATHVVNRGAGNVLALLLKRKLIASNVRSDEGSTLLMEAMKSGNLAIITSLLEQGADVNAVDNKGRTALMYAGNAWRSDTQGARMEAWTPWDKETTRRIVLPILERGARIDIKDKQGVTVMQYASRYFGVHPAMVELLLGRGADPDDALMGIAGSGNPELLQKLIARGADVNRKYPGTYPTPLAYAKSMAKMYPRESYRRVVQVLRNAGAKE